MLTLTLLLASGCAVRSAVRIANADRTVTRAEAQGVAPESAYDHVLAVRYVEKAREAAARSRHRTAVDLARIALDHALLVQPPDARSVPPGTPPADAGPERLWEGLAPDGEPSEQPDDLPVAPGTPE